MNAKLIYVLLPLFTSLLLNSCGESGESVSDGDSDWTDAETADMPDSDAGESDKDIEDGEAERETSEREPDSESAYESDSEIDAETSEQVEPEVEVPSYDGVLFRFPLNNSEGLYSEEYVFGVDHDPEVHEGVGSGICSNYNGDSFPTCYDEHRGSDFILHGGFDKMDEGVVFVYAAADGIVVEIEDGNYDRCHIDYENLGAGNISCDGNPIMANYVKIEHAGGIISMYYHLANGSISVQPGDSISCGQSIGRVGSSGISSCPHLHFQVEDLEGNVIDPFAGALSQPWSYWAEQVSDSGLPGEICR